MWTDEFESLSELYLADAYCFGVGNGTVCERNVLEFYDNDTSTLAPTVNISDFTPPSECPDGWVAWEGKFLVKSLLSLNFH